MRSIGIDLHKRSMTTCVIDKITGETFTSRFLCQDEAKILAFFEKQRPFEVVIEATATYEWLWTLLEPVAARLVLAHPKKLRIIAESKKKTDRFDARTLSMMLAKDEIPEAHRPTPRQREYQQLVKHRCSLVRKRSQIRTQVRSILANRNLDRPGIFSQKGYAYFFEVKLPQAESFCLKELLSLLDTIEEHIENVSKELRKFREAAPAADRKNHEIVKSVPGVGDITADVVLSSLGDVARFPSIQKVTAYAGLVPGVRQSEKKRRELGITKEGPRILRWALTQAAWRATRYSLYWQSVFTDIAKRRGRKRAIVAVARRLLGVIYTLLKKGESYVTKVNTQRAVAMARL